MQKAPDQRHQKMADVQAELFRVSAAVSRQSATA